MKKTNLMFSMAMLLTCSAGAFAYERDFDPIDPAEQAEQMRQAQAAREKFLSQARGPSWLIYRAPGYYGESLHTVGLGQKIKAIDSIDEFVIVVVSKPNGDGQETFKVKYSSENSAQTASKALNESMAISSGLSLDVSRCIKLSDRAVKTEVTFEGKERCERPIYSFTMDCSDAAYTSTPRLQIRQAGMQEESATSGNPVMIGDKTCTGESSQYRHRGAGGRYQ